MFIKHNKPWLKANIQEVLTPRTVFIHRDKIVE
jgi:hypothetical protein